MEKRLNTAGVHEGGLPRVDDAKFWRMRTAIALGKDGVTRMGNHAILPSYENAPASWLHTLLGLTTPIPICEVSAWLPLSVHHLFFLWKSGIL